MQLDNVRQGEAGISMLGSTGRKVLMHFSSPRNTAETADVIGARFVLGFCSKFHQREKLSCCWEY